MALTVRDQEGLVVANVRVDPAHPLTRDTVHVVGSFTAGPGFGRVKSMIEEFENVYASEDLERAQASHELIDRMMLVATDEDGTTYKVSSVYFRDNGLLFSVARHPHEPANSGDQGKWAALARLGRGLGMGLKVIDTAVLLVMVVMGVAWIARHLLK